MEDDVTNRLTRGVFVVVAGIALWAVPSTAGAHAGNDDPTLLHVCIGNANKVVRSVGVSGACIAGPAPVAETPDHWSRAGIPGPRGDKGDKGDNGTNGTNGMDGNSVTFVDYFSGNHNGCANGGAIYAVGNPTVNTYVCNGISGSAATRADGQCFDNANRYVDCGNGTVTDTVTGLIWLKDSACLGSNDWAASNQAAAGLSDGDCSLTDKSSPGDWRLPTHAEWSATIARGAALGCTSALGQPASLTNDAGTDCYHGTSSSLLGVASTVYWSSTSFEATPFLALGASLGTGDFGFGDKDNSNRVWPVRGGPR